MTSSDMRSFARRFMKSMAGRPEPPESHVAVRSVKDITLDLVRIPESDWWKYAFGREPLNGIFTDEQRMQLYEQAVLCGQRYADDCLQKYGDISIEEMAEKMGLEVIYKERTQSKFRVLFADFQEPKTIHIYSEGIDKAAEFLEDPAIREAFGEDTDLTSILMAHELFHVVELRNPKIWTRTYRVQLWKVGKIRNTSPLAVLSEIAAMAFAARLNRIDYSPYVLDAFLVYGYNPTSSSALYEEMIQCAGYARKTWLQSLDACTL